MSSFRGGLGVRVQRRRLRLRALGCCVAVIALQLASCKSGGSGTVIRSPTPLSPGFTPPDYDRALHPFLLLMDFDGGVAAENQLIATCMRERGWSRYPLVKGPPTGRTQLNTIQTAPERRRAARNYGTRLLSSAAELNGLKPYEAFSRWLNTQLDAVRAKYSEDFNGGDTSCQQQALDRLAPTVPSLVPAVAERAGALYNERIIRTSEYQRGERWWHACVARSGFPDAGLPLLVQRPGLTRILAGTGKNASTEHRALERALTKQAVAEHRCSIRYLDSIVRTGELEVVRMLVAEFPQYRTLIPQQFPLK